MKRTALFILLLLAPLLLAPLAHACPGCKDSIASNDMTVPGGPPSGINASVYFMLFAFLGILGALAYLMYRATRHPQPPRGFPVRP